MPMQTAQVSENDNIQLAYIDSGPIPGDTYTTLVCVHGHSYHAQNFSRLFPLAQKYNLRIFALNRRDYTGSTPYTRAELDTLTGSDEDARLQFLKARGLEIARFLVWVITEKKIPQISADGTSGGLAVLGWSLGNVTTMAFLSYLSTYPQEVIETLGPFLRTFFIYELPGNSLGFPEPEGRYHALEDNTVQERMRGIIFGQWVSSYYAHPAYTSDPPIPAQDRSITSLQIRVPKKPYRTCTLDTLTPRDLLTSVDIAPGTRSERPLWRLPNSLLLAQTCGALFLGPRTSSSQLDMASEHDGVGGSTLLPAIKVRVIYGHASLWTVQWETWALEKECAKWEAESQSLRPIKFIPVKDANHFLHWDDAETFLNICVEGIRA
ncbi:hypothetical protein EW145_g5939 [Phellinidium pouzarii]|uniref:AB hydrolase-1 domain-containing protein n=1 Tax=Phellinidium pouzarii TaxID=167371 RepID=A0A4S4KY95_9AGAM|nr:hypothetical protein EW145_g5939 [Phellinidium pouzarii]